jgi:protein-S-isoprenylcysteine O-methyltransferase Ste14
LLVNGALLGLFAVQHSVKARRSFKRWWTRIVPEAVERSTFVLAATLALALLLWQWRPVTTPVVWSVTDPVGRVALQLVFWGGWAVLLISTFLLNHFELFCSRSRPPATSWSASGSKNATSSRSSATATTSTGPRSAC